jgi:FAS-associated factor 2
MDMNGEDSSDSEASPSPVPGQRSEELGPQSHPDRDVDPPPLSDASMEIVLEFQSVTGSEDMEESRRILERHDWDLLRAISSQMGFEQLPPQQFNFPADNDSHQPQPQPHSSHNHPRPGPSTQGHAQGQGQGSSGEDPFLSRRPRGMPMDVSRSHNSPGQGIFGWIWKLLTTPVDFFFRTLWNFLGFGLRILRLGGVGGGDPRQAITNPVQDVVHFINQYQIKYGTCHPNFYQGSYSQALNDAKKELKFLLVYLHSDDHENTEAFCRRVMPNQDFQDIIRENMLFWACSVSTPEGYRTSQALRENTYPFLALIVLKNNKMTVVARIEGDVGVDSVVSRLEQGVGDNEAYLVVERQDRMERSMTQTLRQQQDAAYLESLRADQEKEKKKKEQQEKTKMEQLEKQKKEDEEKQRKETLRRLKIEAGREVEVKGEPGAGEPDVIRMVIKLPNGTRLERRFFKSDSLKHLYLFVFSHSDAPDYFEIATNFPKRTLPCKPCPENPHPPSFIEFGLGRNEMLFVYDLES